MVPGPLIPPRPYSTHLCLLVDAFALLALSRMVYRLRAGGRGSVTRHQVSSGNPDTTFRHLQLPPRTLHMLQIPHWVRAELIQGPSAHLGPRDAADYPVPCGGVELYRHPAPGVDLADVQLACIQPDLAAAVHASLH